MTFSMRDEIAKRPLSADGEQRKGMLQLILSNNGMELRDDSALAYKYICNGGDVHLIAHEIMCTHFLFQYTRYDEICQTHLRPMAESLRERYQLPWKQTWSIVREYAIPALKLYSLAESWQRMPEFDVRIPIVN